MARIEGADAERVEGYLKRVFEAQAKRWGAPLLNHLLYARRPTIFRGVRHVGRPRRLLADRCETGSPRQLAHGRAQRVRVLTGHQRCGRQRTQHSIGEDTGAHGLRE